MNIANFYSFDNNEDIELMREEEMHKILEIEEAAINLSSLMSSVARPRARTTKVTNDVLLSKIGEYIERRWIKYCFVFRIQTR